MRNGWGRAWPQVRFIGSAVLAAVIALFFMIGAMVALTSCIGCTPKPERVTHAQNIKVEILHPNIQPEPVRVRVRVVERPTP